MRRRTDKPISTRRFFDELLHGSLDWPGKTVRLERNTLHDYRQRSGSGQVSIAELYHENSKLFAQMLNELAAAHLDTAAVRREFLSRRAAAARPDRPRPPELNRTARDLLTSVARAAEPHLFYAVELYLLSDAVVEFHEPLTDTFQEVRQLTAAEQHLLMGGLRLMGPRLLPAGSSTVLLVGCFARNDALYGARGYRRTLLEAGRVAQVILELAELGNLAVWPLYEFADRDVDSILELDGTEVGTLMAFTFEGTADVC